MFYCNPCADERRWPKAFAEFAMSYGKCEICGKVRPCNDVPSSALSVPEAAPAPAPAARTRRVFPALTSPFAGVAKVRTRPGGPGGTVFTAMDEYGRYWSGRGWESGVHWSTLLGWGPVEEVFDDDPDAT